MMQQPLKQSEEGLLHCASILAFLLLLLLSTPLTSHGDDAFSTSGRLDLQGTERFDSDSAKEDPSFTGRFRLDTTGSSWRFYSWLEGGWDGTVLRPPRDRSLIKDFDRVYQSNSPFVEVKELFASYSGNNFDLRAGIQRYAWGRLDEYPPNDRLNPWDYSRFLIKPLDDRKIGVPSLSALLTGSEWSSEAVWVPVFVPYRLPMPDERWAGISMVSAISRTVPNADITPREPKLPDRTLENGTVAVRVKHSGDIEWAVSLFNGFDPRPVFKTTALAIIPQGGRITIDPGVEPDFHRTTVAGLDAAAVHGDLSLRAEAACSFNRYLNIRRELWGYPPAPAIGITPLNPDIEERHDVIDYGLGADYRLFEDGLLTVQVQQTLILGSAQLLYERKAETILWGNLKAGFLNQKVETNLNVAYNPEHGDTMMRASVWYVFTDSWKAGITTINLSGPPQSIFGRYANNDQTGAELVYAW